MSARTTPSIGGPNAAKSRDRRGRGPNRRSCAQTLALILVASLALAGCTGSGTAPTPTPSGLPGRVTVAITQQRSDVADRQAEVQIHNGTAGAIRVGAVRLDDPRFSAPATRVIDRTSTLAAGATANIRVQLPEVACEEDATAATSTVTIDYEVDGRAGTGTADAAELFPFLDAIHVRECVAASVTAIADVGLGAFTPSPAGSAAALELTVVPTSADAGEVVLTGIRETNLLSFAGAEDGSLPLGIAAPGADRRAQTVTLPLVPARCDPHAVQEDKRGTVFTIDVVLRGQEGQFTLAADADLRAQLLAWVTQWCGYG